MAKLPSEADAAVEFWRESQQPHADVFFPRNAGTVILLTVGREASPFGGQTSVVAESQFKGNRSLQTAEECISQKLALVPSYLVTGVMGVQPAKPFKCGEVVMATTNQLWYRGKGQLPTSADTASVWQVVVKEGRKTKSLVCTAAHSNSVLGCVHVLAANADAENLPPMNVLEMRVQSRRGPLNIHKPPSLWLFCTSFTCHIISHTAYS